jgi:hypothetical protein
VGRSLYICAGARCFGKGAFRRCFGYGAWHFEYVTGRYDALERDL